MNLAARLAVHVTTLQLPLVTARRPPDEKRCRILIRRPDPKEKRAAVVQRDSDATLTLSGRDGRSLGLLLTGLALSPLEGAISSNWHTAELYEKDDVLTLWCRDGTVLEMAALRVDTHGLNAPDLPDSDPPLDLFDIDRLFFRSVAAEPRARALKLAIQLPDRTLSPALGQALAHLIAWAALESTDVHLPVAFVGPVPVGRTVLRVEESIGGPSGASSLSEPGLTWENGKILARGNGRSLAAVLSGWSRLLRAPKSGLNPADPFMGAIHRARNLLDGAGPEGSLAWHLVNAAAKDQRLPAFSGIERRMARRAARVLELTLPPAARRRAVRRRFSWKGEDDRISAQLQKVRAGRGICRGTILVSRPLDVRQALKTRWELLLREKGYDPDIRVLNAYKPGLCWLMEVVRPRLVKSGGVDQMELAFRTFAAGAGAMEMKSRWLQEAFPAPDLLARDLGLDPAAVHLVEVPDLPEAYLFRAWKKGHAVLEAAFTPRCSRLPYLPSALARQWSHPAAAGAFLESGRGVMLDLTLPTDREVFWRRFQENWLPQLSRAMDERRLESTLAGAPAFWEEVRLEIRIPESDDRLQIGQERVCPLEALHEDLYFGLLGFYRDYAERHGLRDDLNFGRILPLVVCPRAGRPEARLEARAYRPTTLTRGPEESRALVDRICRQDGRWRLFFKIDGPIIDTAPKLAAVAGSWGVKLGLSQRGFHLDIRPPGKINRTSSALAEVPEPPADRRLDLSGNEKWIRRLARLPHLRAWQGGISVEGRPIHVLEARLDAPGISSLGKARLLKPALLFNARHHANEVSSTNAALRLAWRLSRTAEGQELLQRVNVAVIPMENPDGVVTLEALSRGCRDHKLHAARYNALGVEWYEDYHRQRPRFPEAKVKRGLWHRWLPRFVLDAHGVPSHEWDQPFAGTVNPRFREYWIPRAFVFAILPFVNEPAHPAYEAARAVAADLARDMAVHADIGARNAVFADRYKRYARSFAPEVFPTSVCEGLVIVPTAPRIDPSNFGRVHWPLTETEIITEVADEVVEGPWLEMCVRAHLTAAMTLLRRLAHTPRASLQEMKSGGSGLYLAWRKPEADKPQAFSP
ncbi:MAG: M14 family metallopeptidase [Desulfobacterales bacterium]